MFLCSHTCVSLFLYPPTSIVILVFLYFSILLLPQSYLCFSISLSSYFHSHTCVSLFLHPPTSTVILVFLYFSILLLPQLYLCFFIFLSSFYHSHSTVTRRAPCQPIPLKAGLINQSDFETIHGSYNNLHSFYGDNLRFLRFIRIGCTNLKTDDTKQ